MILTCRKRLLSHPNVCYGLFIVHSLTKVLILVAIDLFSLKDPLQPNFNRLQLVYINTLNKHNTVTKENSQEHFFRNL